jgi:hypothetical protein
MSSQGSMACMNLPMMSVSNLLVVVQVTVEINIKVFDDKLAVVDRIVVDVVVPGVKMTNLP